MVREVEVCNASALITRDRDGRLRAFHNICTHRGNTLVRQASGNAPRFTCGYHAWTFSNEGELRGVTDASMFFDLDREKCGLRRIHLDTWQGFVFLNFADEPGQTLLESLGGMADKLDGAPFAKYSSFVSIEGVYDGNWKIALDAFHESYHLGYVHGISFGPNFSAGANPTGRMISAEFFGPHHAGSIWGNRDARPRPVEQTAFASAAMLVAGNNQEEMIGENSLPPTINPTGDPDWGIEMNVLFPSMLIFLNNQGLLVHFIQPLSHDRTRWEFRLYSEPVSNARELFAQQLQLCLSRDSFAEDAIIIESIHANLKSGVLKHFQYQDNEVFPRHLYHAVREAVRTGMTANGLVVPDYIA
jgi:phenylpropionate dioxygenase-like ring-hydroxylating dioxygenase large terminal subunit